MSEENRVDFSSSVPDAPDFLFDDMDLLDLPPEATSDIPAQDQSSVELMPDYRLENTGETIEQSAETGQSVEFENQSEFEAFTETQKSAEFEKIPEIESTDENKINADVEIERQLAALSPELIDAIVRKVTEKMSDKAIREIAWEVVPQMTDLIVRRMAEEKFKE